jgi:hypothetical protein
VTDRNPAEGLVLAEGIVFCRLGSGLAHVNISLSGPIPIPELGASLAADVKYWK